MFGSSEIDPYYRPILQETYEEIHILNMDLYYGGVRHWVRRDTPILYPSDEIVLAVAEVLEPVGVEVMFKATTIIEPFKGFIRKSEQKQAASKIPRDVMVLSVTRLEKRGLVELGNIPGLLVSRNEGDGSLVQFHASDESVTMDLLSTSRNKLCMRRTDKLKRVYPKPME